MRLEIMGLGSHDWSVAHSDLSHRVLIPSSTITEVNKDWYGVEKAGIVYLKEKTPSVLMEKQNTNQPNKWDQREALLTMHQCFNEI